MCRHLAYLGAPVPLARWLFDPPHSLVQQSWAPRDMRGGGTVNADGFGVGWHGDGGVVRYRRHTPIWSDTTLPALAASISSGAVLAAVRSATTGMPVVETAAAPFGDGPWLFSHNGVVTGWPSSVAKLAGALPPEDLLTLDAPTDAAFLWALVRDRLRAGLPAEAAVRSVLGEVATLAPGSRLNLLLTDGTVLVASTAGHSLSVRAGAGHVLVASEPLDAHPGWRPVPDRTLLVATTTGLTTTALGER
jgi:gamma-glutamyl hercynylcysteine S-oxide hydrolase